MRRLEVEPLWTARTLHAFSEPVKDMATNGVPVTDRISPIPIFDQKTVSPLYIPLTLEVDFENKCLMIGDQAVTLAPKPLVIADMLTSNPNVLQTNEALYAAITKDDKVTDNSKDIVKIHISRMHGKINDAIPDIGSIFHSVHGKGYVFLDPEKPFTEGVVPLTPGVFLDMNTSSILTDKEEVNLTASETNILSLLERNRNEAVLFEDFHHLFSDIPIETLPSLLKAHLNRALGKFPALRGNIASLRKRGYIFLTNSTKRVSIKNIDAQLSSSSLPKTA